MPVYLKPRDSFVKTPDNYQNHNDMIKSMTFRNVFKLTFSLLIKINREVIITSKKPLLSHVKTS